VIPLWYPVPCLGVGAVLGVAEPAVDNVVVALVSVDIAAVGVVEVVPVAEPVVVFVVDFEVYALLSAAAELSPEVVVVVAEPVVVFVAVASIADVAELQVSVDIRVAFAVLAPVFVDAVEVDSSGRPRFSVVPNSD
jgi:hypothetical protein